MTIRSIALVFAIGLTRALFAASPVVPIYIEESHAGSFYWLAEHLDLDEECTLIHFDAHSDGSAVFDSDEIRTRLRQVASAEERREWLTRWRHTGVVQCFNWIEPLMPAPISNLIWVRGEKLSKREADALQREVVGQLDGQLEAAPRTTGSFAGRCRVLGLNDLSENLYEGKPVVVTIDLDYFAMVDSRQQAMSFERVWKFVAGCRNLRAVTVSISRPYLSSDDQADELVRLALKGSLSLPTARIQFEPFAKVENDRSLRARELRSQKQVVPAFDPANASEELRALILANRDRIAVVTDASSWQQLLAKWESEAPVIHLSIKDHQPSTDNIWRVPVSESVDVEVKSEPGDAAVERIEWIAFTPERACCNLIAARRDDIGFASGTPPRPRWRELRIPHTDPVLPITLLQKFFDRKTGCGALRLKARVRLGHSVRETPVLEVRRFTGSGFQAGIMEQFGLPYLFGSGELRDGTSTGPETGWGADCANFLVYAFRRQGRQFPWSNPRRLRDFLEPMTRGGAGDEFRITPDDVSGGLVIHFGSHVAAVMQDRPPMGVLDRNDLVAHQLEGVPEVLSLGELLAKRNNPKFDLLRPRHRQSEQPDLIVGGDVMLGRTIGEQIRSGGDPFVGLCEYLDDASLKLVNLECVLSDKDDAALGKQYSLRGPVEAIQVLTAARISAVGLANNHAKDLGDVALLDSIGRLSENGIAVLGAAETPQRAYEPHFFNTRNGHRLALIALTDVESVSDGQSASVATTANLELIEESVASARAGADFVLCLIHWGDENTSQVTERQRWLARWLIDHGVAVVAGSHPHCIQPLDFYHGRPVVYSLGNLVFDGAPSVGSWSSGQLLEVSFGRRGTENRTVRLVPIRLDSRGFPQMAPTPGSGVPEVVDIGQAR